LTWRVEFDKHDWASDHVISIYRLVEIYRNYRRLEDAQNGAQLGAYAVNFKGKSIDEAPTPSRTEGKKDTPTCYCREVHWFHGCPYINELARLKDWKPDEATAKKVEERIASAPDWIKSKIEKLRQ
jgi:hypothetical protein